MFDTFVHIGAIGVDLKSSLYAFGVWCGIELFAWGFLQSVEVKDVGVEDHICILQHLEGYLMADHFEEIFRPVGTFLTPTMKICF